MNNYDRMTPEGTRDALFAECTLRRKIENRLLALFTSLGYSELITPTLEFYDVFCRETAPFSQEEMYKLTDAKGRLLVLRPDNTIPIARVCATRLKDEALPLRLCYNQNIHVISPALKGRDDEITQAGIELIGPDSRMADIEVIAAAADALAVFGKEYRLELGSAAFLRELLDTLPAPEEKKAQIRTYIETKQYPALGDLLDTLPDSDAAQALRKLPRLFGGEEVFETAAAFCRGEKLCAALDELRSLYRTVAAFAGKERVTVDLGMMHRTDYYTGTMLRGYLSGWGEEILSGGRYDRLLAEFGRDVPAIGFAVNVNAVVQVLSKRTRKSSKSARKEQKVLIWAAPGAEAEAVSTAKAERQLGRKTEYSFAPTFAEAAAYAQENGFTEIKTIPEKGV